jgi:hypothetical protein
VPSHTYTIPPSFNSFAFTFYFEIGIGNSCYQLPPAIYSTVPGKVNQHAATVKFEHGYNKVVLDAGQSYVYAAYAVSAHTAHHLYVIDHGTSDVSVWPTGANGNIFPVYRIKNVGGVHGAPQGIAEDATGHIIVTTIAADGVTTSVLVYPPGAKGYAKPDRIITGPHTTLTNNSSDTGVGPDGAIYVNNGNGIAVFAPNADGDAKPARLITGLNGGGAAVSFNNLLYTSTALGRNRNEIDRFGPHANGPAHPIASIYGSRTGVGGHLVGVDSQGNVYQAGTTNVIEFAPYQKGNVFPIRNLSVASAVGLQPIGVDDAGNVFVGDEDGAKLYRFEPHADGNAAPAAIIAGSNTGLIQPAALAVGK